MPKLEDVKVALLKVDGGQELYEVVADAIASASQARKSQVADLETKNGTLLSTLKEIGYDPDSPDPSFAKKIKEQLEAGSKAGETLTAEQRRMKELEGRLTELSEKYTANETKLQQAEAAKLKSVAKELLLPKLKGKIFGANAYVEGLVSSGSVTLDKDGKSLVWKDADSFDKGLEQFFESNKEDLVNTQTGGAGVGNVGGSSTGSKVMVRSEFDKMEVTQRAQFFKDGGQVTD